MNWVQSPFVHSDQGCSSAYYVSGIVLAAGDIMVSDSKPTESLLSRESLLSQSPVWVDVSFLTTWWLPSRTPKIRFPVNEVDTTWPFMTLSQKAQCHFHTAGWHWL